MARDFKSVGIRTDQVQSARVQAVESPPIGISTPLRLTNDGGGFLNMHFDLGNQIADNLRNLVMTNHGERVGIYDFGANLRPLTLELGLPTWEEEAMIRIKTTVSKYMPFVNLQTFEVVIGDQTTFGLGRVAIRMSYTVSGFSDRERAIEIIMLIAG